MEIARDFFSSNAGWSFSGRGTFVDERAGLVEGQDVERTRSVADGQLALAVDEVAVDDFGLVFGVVNPPVAVSRGVVSMDCSRGGLWRGGFGLHGGIDHSVVFDEMGIVFEIGVGCGSHLVGIEPVRDGTFVGMVGGATDEPQRCTRRKGK